MSSAKCVYLLLLNLTAESWPDIFIYLFIYLFLFIYYCLFIILLFIYYLYKQMTSTKIAIIASTVHSTGMYILDHR